MYFLRFWIFGAAFAMLLGACAKGDAYRAVDNEDYKVVDDVNYEDVFQADPTVFYHEGVYYLYGTNDQNPNQGFQVYTSTDLEVWEGPAGPRSGYALDRADVFGDQGFWAPQVWYEDGLFYMAYTANENIAIATSTSPLGPFKQDEQRPLADGIKQIDPFVFTDEDGKRYLFHVRLSEGNRIYVAELEDDYSGIKARRWKPYLSPTSPGKMWTT